MPGERDLKRLLEMINPELHAERYSFAASADHVLHPGVFALVREDEGLTVVHADPDGKWARISLGVHSSLEAVGLTAALSARLAEAGISANVIAGRNHDHFFVPWDRREEALEKLRAA